MISTRTDRSAAPGRIALVVALAVGLLLLVGSWVLVYGVLMIATEALLAPWDVTPGRPPLGAWDRAVNDFFENWPGSQLPAVSVLAASVLLFAVALRRRPRLTQWVGVPFSFGFSNLIYVVVVFAAMFALHQVVNWWLPYPTDRFDAGFHRTWPHVAAMVALTGLLLRFQGWLARPPA